MFCGFGDNLTYADCEKTGKGGDMPIIYGLTGHDRGGARRALTQPSGVLGTLEWRSRRSFSLSTDPWEPATILV